MPTRFRVIPYRAGSRSATAISRALGGMCVRLNGQSRFRPRREDVIINWGNTNPGEAHFPTPPRTVLNLPNQVRNASNKLFFFGSQADAGNEERIPPFWTNRDQIPDDAFPVVCRTVLAGHSGEGIVIADTREQLVQAPLYVKYIKKLDEFRVHVGRLPQGELSIIAVQQKRRRLNHPDAEINWKVRNHQNGFIYARENVNAPEAVLDAARAVLPATGLDFGAVDVIYNDRQARPYVLEVNTAPGLEGTTLDDYARYFNTYRR